MNQSETVKNWGEVFQEWGSSGKKQKAFCQDKGIPFSTFRYYREKMKLKPKRASRQEAFRAVEIGRFYPMAFSTLPIFLGMEGITIAVHGEDVSVKLQGSITLERLGRIVMACGGDGEAKAGDA
jgi:hypothetical protein